ncbi:hypothetical protein BE221DRAFT_11533 [Ostreococcus tauri]|uniref:Uncharacterized protein n=1 Tax=Ostreococcus tauri TaxID=70448 RepID=A0A1Y5I8J5_OSTTA|nr:hypothetical protein BE221DRAFT_11533 [Ostreococcus tauri]
MLGKLSSCDRSKNVRFGLTFDEGGSTRSLVISRGCNEAKLHCHVRSLRAKCQLCTRHLDGGRNRAFGGGGPLGSGGGACAEKCGGGIPYGGIGANCRGGPGYPAAYRGWIGWTQPGGPIGTPGYVCGGTNTPAPSRDARTPPRQKSSSCKSARRSFFTALPDLGTNGAALSDRPDALASSSPPRIFPPFTPTSSTPAFVPPRSSTDAPRHSASASASSASSSAPNIRSRANLYASSFSSSAVRPRSRTSPSSNVRTPRASARPSAISARRTIVVGRRVVVPSSSPSCVRASNARSIAPDARAWTTTRA